MVGPTVGGSAAAGWGLGVETAGVEIAPGDGVKGGGTGAGCGCGVTSNDGSTFAGLRRVCERVRTAGTSGCWDSNCSATASPANRTKSPQIVKRRNINCRRFAPFVSGACSKIIHPRYG